MRNFDYSQLKEYQKKLDKIADTLPAFNEAMVKELAARLLRAVKKRTPVAESYSTPYGSHTGGELRRNWTVSEVQYNGAKVTIDVINPTEYAIYVEYGHRQQKGRFVPVLGKRLKQSWVEGRFMLTKSEMELDGKMEAIVRKKLEKWLGEQLL